LYSKARRTAETSRFDGQYKDSALRNTDGQIDVLIDEISRIGLSSELADRLPGDPPNQIKPSKRCNHDCKRKYKLPEFLRHCHEHSLLALARSNFL
jgi:hypothetical protein